MSYCYACRERGCGRERGTVGTTIRCECCNVQHTNTTSTHKLGYVNGIKGGIKDE